MDALGQAVDVARGVIVFAAQEAPETETNTAIEKARGAVEVARGLLADFVAVRAGGRIQ